MKDAAALFYSAIYFKGKWFQPFKRSHTENDKFYVTADNAIDDVPFMEQVLRAKSGECTDLGAKWVQLNYDVSIYTDFNIQFFQKMIFAYRIPTIQC